MKVIERIKKRSASNRSLERRRGRLVGDAQDRLHLRQQRHARSPRVVIEITVELVPNGQAVQLQRLRGYWHASKGGELVTTIMSNEEIRAYLAKIGSVGGKKSKRVLTPEQAKAMVAAREKKRRKTNRVTRRSNVSDQRWRIQDGQITMKSPTAIRSMRWLGGVKTI